MDVENYNLRRNVFWLSYNILKSIHQLAGHPTVEDMQQNLESPMLSMFGFRILLVLVVQNCPVCRQSEIRREKRKSRKIF